MDRTLSPVYLGCVKVGTKMMFFAMKPQQLESEIRYEWFQDAEQPQGAD